MKSELLNAALAFLATVAGVVGPIFGLGWWLSGRFRSVEVANAAALAEHDKEDQRRHEENLERFRRTTVSLARLGDKNGGAP